MKAEYKREQGRTWVLFEGADSRMAGMEMLRRNKIPGLASFYEEWEDNCWHYGYEITGAQPLALLLEFRPLTEEMVRILILQVAELFQKLEQYLLEPDGIILDPEFLYLEPDHLRCRFFYCPDQPGNWKDHIRELIWLFLGQAPENRTGIDPGPAPSVPGEQEAGMGTGRILFGDGAYRKWLGGSRQSGWSRWTVLGGTKGI